MRASQTRGDFFRLQFDQTSQTFHDCGLSDAGFAHQHRRVGAFTMTENLDDLLNLQLTSNGRRNLVLTRQAVQRHTKMFEVRWQLELLSILLFLLLTLLYLNANVLRDCFRSCSQTLQHLDKQAVISRERFEDVGCFYCLTALRSRSLHGALEKIGRVGCDAETFAYMLLTAALETSFDCDLNGHRI